MFLCLILENKGGIKMEMNKDQVKCILQYIDTAQSDQIKRDIFCQLGIECFHARHVYDWIMSFHGYSSIFRQS
jgi:hypothetical protein